MAKAIRCDACQSVGTTSDMKYIRVYNNNGNSNLTNVQLTIQSKDQNGIDVCEDCYHKVLEVLNANERPIR